MCLQRAVISPLTQATYHSIKVWFLFRTASGLEFGSLHLGADHSLAEEGLTAKEELVVVPAAVITGCQPVEAVEIQLPLEAGQLRLAEVVWHDMVHKLLRLVNHKASSMGLP